MSILEIALWDNISAANTSKTSKKATQQLAQKYNSIQKSSQSMNDLRNTWACDVHKNINNLEDFIKNYDHLNSSKLNEHTCEEIISTNKNIDYEAEYSKYLKERGCENDDELKALNEAGFYTASQLRLATFELACSTFIKASEKGLFGGNPFEAAQFIADNCSILEISYFTVNMNKVIDNEYLAEMNYNECLSYLLSLLPEEMLGEKNLGDILEEIERMNEILKERYEKNQKTSYEYKQDRIFNIEDIPNLQDGNNVINLTAFNEYSKQTAI